MNTTITRTQQLLIGGLLLLFLVFTRGHITSHLQDASWAVFFLVGFYLRGSLLARYAFPLFFLVAFIVDLVVIDAQGGTHYCFTPSYPFLIPSYAAMWFAGRWFSKQSQDNAQALFKFVGAALVGTVACFLISNLGFYFFAGKFETMSVLEYAQKVSKYLPAYLTTTGVYLGFTALLHLAIVHGRKLAKPAHS